MATQRRFPIGFWNYTSIEQHAINHNAVACVKDWAEAGMTLAMGPNYGSGLKDVKRMRAILDAAAEADIRVILSHNDGTWPHLAEKGEKAYRRDFAKAVKDLGHHRAVSGFHVGDEPAKAQFADACQALRIQKELAPHLSPFCNLLPWYDKGTDQHVGCESWAKYLDAYSEKAKPDFLCYDCYTQMNPPTAARHWDIYFQNLWEYHEAARRHTIPFWTTLLSVGHFCYRCPTEDDLRWQLNTAVASGAKGILWFFFYMREPHDNYRVAPIDEHWERTETYAWLSRVCRTFLKWQAPILLESKLVHACHVGQSWGFWPKFDGVGLVAKADSSSGTPLIVSQFKHAGGADYLAVVNNSQTQSTYAELVIRGDHPSLLRVGWQGREDPLFDSTGQGAEHGADYIKASRWLAPGQMELWRLGNR